MVEEIVSEFITMTSGVHQQPDMLKGLMVFKKLKNAFKGDLISSVLTGSASEFYIDPMLPCVGDIDFMIHRTDLLVVPKGHHVTQYVQLPVEFHSSDEIKLYEFVDSPFPGYVFTRLVDKLNKYIESYKFVSKTEEYFYSCNEILSGDLRVQHGPAITTALHADPLLPRSLDGVECQRCLVWPPQAAEWITRRRHFGYPNTTTIEQVVHNGCDLVNTTHRSCKLHDDWCNKYMKRISFSRAKTVLLNSWTFKQQIVYHLLRYIVERVGFIETSSDESTQPSQQPRCGIFRKYHLKVLMLWSCEVYSEQWWTQSLVHITTQLLHDLAELLTVGECPNYFMEQCNLFDYFDEFHSSDIQLVISILSSFTDDKLCTWLIDNYVSECVWRCPDHISQLMNDTSTMMKFHNALSAIVNWRVDRSLRDSLRCFAAIISMTCFYFVVRVQTRHEYRVSFEELLAVDRRLSDVFIACVFIHITKTIIESEQEIVEYIYELLQFSESRDSLQTKSWLSSTKTSFKQSTDILMKLKIITNQDTLLLVELTKVFLHESINNIDDHQVQVHVHCLTRVYLASLYYFTGQYRTAIDQLLLATTSCQSQCSSHVVEGRLLPDNDDVITIVSGLIVLHQFIQRTASSQQEQSVNIDVFDVRSLSFYYVIQCASHVGVSYTCTGEVLRRYRNDLRQRQTLFIGDVLLLHFTISMRRALSRVNIYSRQCNLSETMSRSKEYKTFRLRCLLIQSAVQRLTAVRHVMSRDYSSICTIITTDYEAIYAYKCGEYEQCAELCEQIVDSLLNEELPVIHVRTTNLLLLMDDDFKSFVGLTLLHSEYLEYTESVFDPVTQLPLSLYLLLQCKLQLKLSVTSFVKFLHCIVQVYIGDGFFTVLCICHWINM